MLCPRHNGNSLAVSIFQAPPQAHVYLLQEADNSRRKCRCAYRYLLSCICEHSLSPGAPTSHKSSARHRHRRIYHMRHCPMAWQPSRRHNAAVLWYNEGNVGAAIVTPLHVYAVCQRNSAILSWIQKRLSHRQPRQFSSFRHSILNIFKN